jgi:hypothetical protein
MLVLVFLSLQAAQAGAAEISASVPYQKIGEEDQLELTIRVSGEGSQSVDFIDLPPLEGFDVVSTSHRTSINIINGVTTSSKDFIFILLPQKQGALTIPAVEVAVGDDTLKTEPIEVTVAAGSILGSRRRSRRDPLRDPVFGGTGRRSENEPIGDNVFVRAEASRTSLYHGEQVNLTYKLYTRYNIKGLDMTLPSLTGFWVEPIELPPSLRPDTRIINNKEYYVFTVRRSALFPSTSGELVIDPVTFTIDVELPGSDPFFSSIFGRTERIFRKTKPVSVTVKGLPQEGRPADFNGAVGAFELSAEADKETSRVNDAINLKLSIRGRGNIKQVSRLPLPDHPDFKVFDAKESSDIGLKGGVMQGHKNWEYVLMPTTAGEHVLEPVRFSFFDPEAGAYKTLSGPAMTIRVEPGDEPEEVSITQLPDGRVIKQRHTDIRYIKPAPDRLRNENNFLFRRGLFFLLLLLPVILNACALIYRKKREHRSRDYAGYRFRQARKKAGRFLKEAGRLLNRGEKEKFSETLTTGLYAYLADKLNLSAAGLTLSEAEGKLRANRVSPETVDALTSHLEQLDMSRFGKYDMDGAEMESLFRASRDLIFKIEKEYR